MEAKRREEGKAVDNELCEGEEGERKKKNERKKESNDVVFNLKNCGHACLNWGNLGKLFTER